MSRCPQCKTDYPEHILVCAVDGEVLNADVHEVGAESAAEAEQKLSMKMMAVGDTVALPLPALTVQLTGSSGSAAANKDELPAGFKVGEYEVSHHIGSGGMAAVYAGVQPVIGKKVAIKVLSRMLSSDHSMVERFVQEARAVNQIRHHNIVDIFALGELPDGRAYCVMELLTGETLKDRLRHGSPTYEEVVSILSQICEGLDAAHRSNVVHRDLKPDNIFLVESNRGSVVKILDFGIAKLLDSETAPAQRTRAGILMGTPEYMSPEQCSGRDVDARADIYLLGVMMYEMFTGRLPFAAATPIMTINAHVSDKPTDPRMYADLPPQLRALILECLEKEPKDRPQTALEVRDQLIDVVQALGVDVASVLALPRLTGTRIPRTRTGGTGPRHTFRAVRKSRVPRVIGGIVILALAGVGLMVVVKTLGGDQVEEEPKPEPGVAPAAVDAAAPVELLALQIISDPPGANVTIDGRPQALRSPYVFKVPWAEKVAIRVELAGYHPYEEMVALGKGEVEKVVDAKMSPIAGPTPTMEPDQGSAGGKTVRAKGSPPVIRELQLTPDSAVVGERTTITGMVKFEDLDGDVASIRVEVRGSKKLAQSTALRVAGAKSGTAAFTLQLTPAKAGVQSVIVTVQDQGENLSNKLSGTIETTAKDKPHAGSGSAQVPDRTGSGSAEPDKPDPEEPDKPDKPDKEGSGSAQPE